MSDSTHCPRCGAPLPRGSELCAACMLRHDLEGGVPEPPQMPARPAAEPDLTELRRDFPQLEVLRLVGRGGMGLVYEARQRRLDRPVALKVLAPEIADDAQFAERFLREARALAKLSHSGLVGVHDFGQSAGRYFLVMEFVDGPSLRQRLIEGPLDVDEAAGVLTQACAALQYAHDEGVVHRDVKPENLLLGSDGRVRLADFGLAKLLGLEVDQTRLTRLSQAVGTPHYMAPEQVNAPQGVDHRADVYALGVLLYEMLTGKLPVGRFALPSELAGIDPRFDEVVLTAMQQEPADRFASAAELALRVDDIVRGPGAAGAQGGPRTQEAQGTRTAGGRVTTRRIPFKNADRLDGIVEIHGLVGLSDEGIVLQSSERTLGLWESAPLSERLIPFRDLAAARFKKGWFGSQIHLRANDLTTFEDLPQPGTPGVFRLCFTRDDAQAAQEMAAEILRRIPD